MLLHEIKLTNFLSFGNADDALELKPLNIIIGPNGSGKSNLLEAIDLLKCAPDQVAKPVREGGGVQDWIYKGEDKSQSATVDVVIDKPAGLKHNIRYLLSFSSVQQRFQIEDEKLLREVPVSNKKPQPYFYYDFNKGHPMLNVINANGEVSIQHLQAEDIDFDQSILAQRRDPVTYPEITDIARKFSGIRLYREWSFGRYAAPRLPQKADLPNDYLEPDCSNLGLMLNKFEQYPKTKREILDALNKFAESITDYSVKIDSGTVQVFITEGDYVIPATRLSDGTLRYLCLLAILCHPTPPPLVCIEEPELGLHPDILPALAELLKKASEKCQLIVTTHSNVIIDSMTDSPEAVIVAEKDNNGTKLSRLNVGELKVWLEKYRLGELWTRGDIGGNRW
jgi:predicted ATPase